MGMFSWQTSGTDESNSGSRISPDFWIYWAVTVPLTIVTVSGWAIWWKFEKYRFDRDVQRAVQTKPVSRLGQGFKLPWLAAANT
jgi:hypothetical protein